MKKLLVFLICVLIPLAAMNSMGVENKSPEYTGSDACQSCHANVYTAWKSSKHANVFNPPSDASPVCSGCHTTGIEWQSKNSKENSVGCEACHGPGQDHIEGAGDPDKIVSDISADICGRCHNGNRSGDDTEWMSEYRPGMKLSDLRGLKLISVNSNKIPPPVGDIHPSLTYNMWLASGHARTPDRSIKLKGRDWTGPVTCVACHDSHSSNNPYQLIMEPDQLCAECHSQYAVQKGKGAKGIEETRSLHTASHCFSCHMTEKNHLMKVLRPDDPDLAKDRTDSCSDCHEIKDREMRAYQLKDWESWYREGMDPIQADLQTIEAALKKAPDLLNPELKAKLEDIKANLSIIINDGSDGVHNLDYALEIMSLARRELKDIKKAIE